MSPAKKRKKTTSRKQDALIRSIKKKINAPEPKSLDAALAVEGDFEFMHALADWVGSFPGRRAIEFESIAEDGRMFIALTEFLGAINSSGLLYVFDWTIGDQFHQAHGWFEKIGAKRSAAYFAEAAKLFPKGRVPNDRDKRQALIAELDENPRTPNPLDTLDAVYREDVLAEVPARLRDWTRRNRKAVERALSTLAPEGAGTSPDDILPHKDMIEELAAIHDRAKARGVEDLPPQVVAIGDVIEIGKRKKRVYVQITHAHAFSPILGYVVRVLPGVFKERISMVALRKLVSGPTRYFVKLNPDQMIQSLEAAKLEAGRIPAHARPFPVFLYHFSKTRDGRNVWGTWHGGATHTGRIIGPIAGEQRTWPILRYAILADEFAEGWSPEDEFESWGE